MHDVRHQTKFIKYLNERNSIELLTAQNRVGLKAHLLIHIINSKIQETQQINT